MLKSKNSITIGSNLSMTTDGMTAGDLDRRFAASAPDVVHELVDGELVIVNLRNGKYFSLDGAGADFWQLLITAAPLASVSESLAQAYAIRGEEIEAHLLPLVDQLLGEELIVPAEASHIEAAAAENPPSLAGGTFVPPELKIYTDMEELLLVDPVLGSDDSV
jgi:hypothetical protein